MAHATRDQTNYQLLRLYLDSIPHYEGNPHTLGIFLDNCEHLIHNFASETDATLNNFIIRAIFGKLTGRALSLIGSRTELKTWNEIKESLTLCFGDQRNIDCLIQDLITLCPTRNETPYNFGMRCQDARSLLHAKLNLSNTTAEEKKFHISNYNNLALKTFIRGLPNSVQTNVRLRKPDSLEIAMSYVIEEENFMYSTNQLNTLNTSSTFRPAQRITPAKPHLNHTHNITNPRFTPLNYSQNKPIFNNNTNTRFTQNNLNPSYNQHRMFNPPRNIPSFPTHQPQITRPNPPYNTQSNFRQTPNQYPQRPQQFPPRQNPVNYPQNRSYFQNHPHTQNNPRNFIPEPMDTSSGTSRIKPQQKFSSNELFNQDIETTKIQQNNYANEPEFNYLYDSEYNCADYNAQGQEGSDTNVYGNDTFMNYSTSNDITFAQTNSESFDYDEATYGNFHEAWNNPNQT